MKFDAPAATNPIDQLKVVGKATDRIEGPLKTTGRAPYAYEWHDVAKNVAYGYIVGAPISKGKIAAIESRRAERAPGVLAVITHENAGKLEQVPRNTAALLAGAEIHHYHQAIALVVAETFEQARAAASLLRVKYARTAGAYDLEAEKDDAPMAPMITVGAAASAVGDFDGAYAAAPMQLDEVYTTPDHSHMMMEPPATLAAWEGEKLTLWTSNQMIDWGRSDMAKMLGMAKENVRLVSPYVGGGFGGKLFLRADALLAAIGARVARRPVKVAMQRALIANNTTHRPATIQRIRIGATREGKITAIAHESWSGDLPKGTADGAVQQTRMLYNGEHRMTATRLAVLDLPEANAMRAPGEATGMMALEIAIDEMAEKVGMDPVEFRIINDTQVVPDDPPPPPAEGDQSKTDKKAKAAEKEKQKLQGQEDAKPSKPFSQRQLVQCMRLGAERFGWHNRSAKPGSNREGVWLIGYGVASSYRGNPVMNSAARVRVDKSGHVTVETDMTDIGTGSYTIIAQTAAEMMGVPLKQVTVRLGDSDFPVSAGSGGQWGGNSSTSGVYAACTKLREMIAEKLGVNAADAVFADGRVGGGGLDRDVALGEAVGEVELVAEDGIEFGEFSKEKQQSTFGAHFVEVGVHAATGETRLRRMLAVCAAGRILNPKAARSQVIGAMAMGVGAALMEGLVVDKRSGFFVNHDLASYEVPAHADIPHQDVVFLDETDPLSSPMKAKGVGELGICGVAAAVANAIYNATGVRVRDYPITLDKLIDGLPDLGVELELG